MQRTAWVSKFCHQKIMIWSWNENNLFQGTTQRWWDSSEPVHAVTWPVSYREILRCGTQVFSVKYRIKNGKHCLYIRSHDVKFSKVASFNLTTDNYRLESNDSYDNHVGISKLKYQYKKFELAITLAKSRDRTDQGKCHQDSLTHLPASPPAKKWQQSAIFCNILIISTPCPPPPPARD